MECGKFTKTIYTEISNITPSASPKVKKIL